MTQQQYLSRRVVDLVECHMRLGGTPQTEIDRLINRPFLEGQIFNLLQRQPAVFTPDASTAEKVMIDPGAERSFPPPPELTLVECLENRYKLNAYIKTLTGEILGWIVYPSKKCFSPVQRVHSDPVNGPVVVIETDDGWDVFEVDCDTVEVYGTDLAAMAVYFVD